MYNTRYILCYNGAFFSDIFNIIQLEIIYVQPNFNLSNRAIGDNYLCGYVGNFNELKIQFEVLKSKYVCF